MVYDIFDSPIGALTVSADVDTITGLHIEGDRYFRRVPDYWQRDPSHPLLMKVGKELKEYFAGTRKTFDVPITVKGTDFQKEVWQALRNLPAGTTTTYAALAAKIGKPKAVRAVGSAAGRNPICIIIPCHRVLASSGGLGGFVAGLPRKQQLLDAEKKMAAIAHSY